MNKFTSSAQNALNSALYTARELGHTYIGSEHLLLAMLYETGSVAAKLLAARNITADSTKKELIALAGRGEPTRIGPSDMTPRAKRIIELSAYEAMKHGQSFIGTEHLLLALLGEQDCVGIRLLVNQGAKIPELYSGVSDFCSGIPDGTHTSDIPPSAPSEGKRKTAVSQVLTQYGRDLTVLALSGKLDPIIGREEETERVIQVLSRRTKNNPCLIGDPGVGKTAVVEGLARRIADGTVPDTLTGKSIIALDLTCMIAGAKYRGEFEERMKNVMNEVRKNPSVILFIDEIHTIMGAGAAEGAIDAANILKPALSRGELHLIGATTVSEYRRHIEKDTALERRFQPVMIGEPTAGQTKEILCGLRDKFEEHHKVKISGDAIDAAVSLSVRYLCDRFLPDKAIDLIDEAASRARIRSRTEPDDLRLLEEKVRRTTSEKEEAIRKQDFELAAQIRDEEINAKEKLLKEKAAWESHTADDIPVIGEENIREIVTLRTGIPVSQIGQDERKRLNQLSAILKERIIGQDAAVDAVARCIRRGRTGLKSPDKPIGSFLFCGPSGVGKTELCRVLAEALFGTSDSLIRLDMSEYIEKQSVSRLIGSPPGYIGYDAGGQLTGTIRTHPYSVVLFDEIEKAHSDVLGILLQLLDDGHLTDSQGRTADFRNTVVIMTSNLGAELLTGRAGITGFIGNSSAGAENAVKSRLREFLRPELLNRVDETVIFQPLSRESIEKIASHLLEEEKKRVAALGIDVIFEESVGQRLALECTEPEFGVRPLRRAIQTLVEDRFADLLLSGELTDGDRLTVSALNGEILFTKEK